MSHERVYHPETCEPFDVPSAKAADLRLNHGWSSTPWSRQETPAEEPAFEPVRGRGRRRRAVEEVPAPADDEVTEDVSSDDDELDTDEPWRS